MNNLVIKVEGLKKAYKNLPVLKNVTFEVEKGSVFALLGENGCGKTTTVRILSTLLKKDGGECFVNGYDVQKSALEVRKSISLTGQFCAVDEVLTGRENLIMIGKLRNVKNPKEVAESLLEKFGLTKAADKRTATYSGGMTRRLDLALSLIGTPSIIFLDEPTTGLDPKARKEVWDVIAGLVRGGTTIFLTTQYLEEAEQLADRIAILHEGVIIVNDSLSELKKLLPKPKIEYVEKQPTLEEVYFAITEGHSANPQNQMDSKNKTINDNNVDVSSSSPKKKEER